ncbi:hypothetical protein PC116_g2934 [Phytophthora cactorum]|nr:hypothetical protein Pcac1_g13363 [Phytophthora cactorum]KAG3013106.1 hypothetical protein PC119_g12647 [Phytophthora cactorum]KAG3016882.1 hypothetical protein PC120_g11346 [Phytophthora cactorum]KAG3147864.1 hypothetical protein C6341_g17590 [Phytophthora cactorum]KAG4053725.1 hypothetical protein PC123_g11131 [Phytophthora cactorum]
MASISKCRHDGDTVYHERASLRAARRHIADETSRWLTNSGPQGRTAAYRDASDAAGVTAASST